MLFDFQMANTPSWSSLMYTAVTHLPSQTLTGQRLTSPSVILFKRTEVEILTHNNRNNKSSHLIYIK